MKFSNTCTLLVAAGCLCGIAHAQLEIVTNATPQAVFFGTPRSILISFHNPANRNFDAEIRTRILQTSSATAVLISEAPWKRLQVPAGETVLKSAQLNFPAVKAETKFLVQWLENTNQVIGRTEVWVYPTNLLNALKSLLGGEDCGVLDPNSKLKPSLRQNEVKFLDLDEMALEDFTGKLAIIGPFQAKSQMPEGLGKSIQRIASKGVAVVWIQPPPEERDKPWPSFYSVLENTNAVVVVQPELVADLPGNPQSQLNLICFCKVAFNPRPPVLPGFSPQSEP